MKKLLFLLILGLVATTAALANNGGKNNDNNGDKGDKGARAKSANRLEEFIWTIPQGARVDNKVEEGEMQKAMVDLYKWYLQNETRIKNNSSLDDNGETIVAPFKVDPKVLQQYLQFIKKNFPGLNEDDLNDKPAAVSNVARKNAPVSYSPDVDAPMSLPTTK
ncbi:hypothetical protein ACWKWU_09780 [Chitinophaga lutea]